MSQPSLQYGTEQEYLSLERAAKDRHEYYKGEIFAMSGASYKHNIIQVNLLVMLGNHLRDKDCRPFGSDLRLHIPSNSLYTYPDIMVLCEEPRFIDNEFDTLINPAIIIEILSPSTANYDRGAKFDLYREIPSLKEYILIDSAEVHIVHYGKNNDGTWTLSETKALQDSLSISTIEFQQAAAGIYSGF